MKLTVLNVAFPFAPVGPDSAGGAEQVLRLLDSALVRAGHKSVIIACEGSVTEGTLVPTPRYSNMLNNEEVLKSGYESHRQAIESSLRQWPIDVIHMHGIDFYRYLPPPGVPVLVTLHLPPEWYPREVFHLKRPGAFLHCVSKSQRRACPKEAILLPEIENGVPINSFPMRAKKRDFAMTLGRVCPEKGLHIALDAAKRAQASLLLCGKVFPYESHESYFREEIVPRLDRARRFIGPVGWERKRHLLSAARCLLIPSLVPETSSLVAMEALACGTPVIAFPSGALADIVEHGKTGFLVQNEREMAEAIAAVKSIDPNICRNVARKRFSVDRMIKRYLETYEHLAKGDISLVAEKTEEAQEEFNGKYTA